MKKNNGIHLPSIFPHLKFPNVQLKPIKSHKNGFIFQVESKVAGIGCVNPNLLNKHIVLGTFRTLTTASLASNFLISVLNRLRLYLITHLSVNEKFAKKPKNFIRLPHIRFSDQEPLQWYGRYNEGILKGVRIQNMGVDSWWLQIVQMLIDNPDSFQKAKEEIKFHGTNYGDCLLIVNNISKPSYLDPSEWNNPMNEYLTKGTFWETKKEKKKKSKDHKIEGDEKTKPLYMFSPRITAVGGGPKGMSLVYHLCFDDVDVWSPCFFNKNFFEYSKTQKFHHAQSKKSTECEECSKKAKNLPRIIIHLRRNFNYYGGTFDVDYYKNEGLKLEPWASTQPFFNKNTRYTANTQPYTANTQPYTANTQPYMDNTQPYMDNTQPYMDNIPNHVFSMPQTNIGNIQQCEQQMKDSPSKDNSLEDFANDLEGLIPENDDDENESDLQKYANNEKMDNDGKDEKSEEDEETDKDDDSSEEHDNDLEDFANDLDALIPNEDDDENESDLQKYANNEKMDNDGEDEESDKDDDSSEEHEEEERTSDSEEE